MEKHSSFNSSEQWGRWLSERQDKRWLEKAKAEYEKDLHQLMQALQSRNFVRARGSALNCVQSGGRYLGYLACSSGQPADQVELRRVLAYGLWGWALTYAKAQRGDEELFGPSRHEENLVWLFSLALAGGAGQPAQWLGRYLLNTYVAGTIDARPGDLEFNELFWALVRAYDKHEWPALEDLPAELGAYRTLFESVGDPGAFRETLADICNLIVERGLEDDSGAGRPHIYSFDPWGYFPLDLLAFKAIREAVVGTIPAFDVEHPLMQPALARIPDLSLPFEDEVTRELSAAGREWFGPDWEPWAAIPLLE